MSFPVFIFRVRTSLEMAGTSTVKGEFFPVSLKSVAPVIPKNDKEKLHLVEDLMKINFGTLNVEEEDNGAGISGATLQRVGEYH